MTLISDPASTRTLRPILPTDPTAARRDGPTGSRSQQLWNALIRARTGDTPRTRAHVEDAVFGSYLPLARTLARNPVTSLVGVDEAEQAAELGLAQAVLAWRQPDSDGFERFARAAITSELERVVDRGPIRRRPDDVVPGDG